MCRTIAKNLLASCQKAEWISRSTVHNGAYNIQHECYENIFNEVVEQGGRIFKTDEYLIVFVRFPDDSVLKIGLWLGLIREVKEDE